jgi:TolB-like protein/Tfp pilus assembly protein PilF
MGQVWLATDRRLGRNVAIKFIGEDVSESEQVRARMRREARSISALNHPNICSLFDVGEDEGADYLVMEYVEGDTLAERLASGPLPVDSITAIGAQVVEAIREAHHHGVTHRDLKPANIMITSRGLVKVLDFGLATAAKEVSADSATHVRSSAGLVIGTLSYMSPEQASGSVADARSDIFSIGVTLYEMATGRRPFEGTPAQIGAQLLNSDPRPVRSLNRQIPVKLERLITRCMQKDPKDRYQSADDLLADLRAVTDRKRIASSPARSAVKKAKVESIAVLPFANATGDPQLDYLSDGIAEGVLDQLSRVGDLQVLARSTTFRYRQATDPIAVGRELKVRAVLTGEVSMRRGSVAVSAELIDAKSGSHLWGNSYADAEAQSVQEDIARGAAGSLNTRSVMKPARAAVDDEAFRLYLRGRHSLNKWTSESVHSAVRSFQQAIDRDPTFALGFAGLADAYLMFDQHSESAVRGSLTKARAAAMRALSIDDSIAEAHTSLAMVEFNQWNWDAAERGFQRAIVINPSYVTAHYWYSMYLITRKRLPEALEKLERAQEIDPLSATIAAHLAACKAMNGRAEEAIRELKKLAELAPETPMINQWLGYAYYTNGQLERSIEAARRGVEASNNGNLALCNLGFLYGKAGRTEEARDVLQQVLARDDLRPLWVAGIYAGLGDVENTMRGLEGSIYADDRSGDATFITWPPWFDELQSEPRYVALLQHMKLL